MEGAVDLGSEDMFSWPAIHSQAVRIAVQRKQERTKRAKMAGSLSIDPVQREIGYRVRSGTGTTDRYEFVLIATKKCAHEHTGNAYRYLGAEAVGCGWI